MKGELLYTGSVKLVYQSTERADQVVFDFSDRISVFDKRIPNVVPQKGAVICGLASFWFERCQALGLRTHFVERLSPTEMLVERVDIERDYDRIQPDRRSVLVPCEFIVRHYVAGSFLDRFREGGFVHGQRLQTPCCETSTKVEPTDRLIDRADALQISKLTSAELDGIWATCLRVDALIGAQVALVEGRLAVVPFACEQRPAREHIELGQGIGGAGEGKRVVENRGGERGEEFVLAGEGVFFGVEDFFFLQLESLGDVALTADGGLTADIVRGNELQVGFGDLDVVTKIIREADFETANTRALLLGAFQIGQPGFIVGRERTKAVEFGIVTGADEIAVGEIVGQFGGKGGLQQLP